MTDIDSLFAHLVAMGDDELVLGHRDSEWCGHAPILEEDIAFANIALDEIGHAMLWYGLAAEVKGQDKEQYPNQLAYLRSPDEFRNAPLVELPKGDWAFSMLRQYLFDVAEAVRLKELTGSSHTPLAEAARKAQREELYHVRHTSMWVKRLGLGTEESHRRMQDALNAVWPYAQGYFEPLPSDQVLIDEKVVVDPASARSQWEATVRLYLSESGLSIPETHGKLSFNRKHHQKDLKSLLADMQSVARVEPDARW
jgi:ring-1,2-phenylacetyl-CoA epoxidase subunit PaaC